MLAKSLKGLLELRKYTWLDKIIQIHPLFWGQNLRFCKEARLEQIHYKYVSDIPKRPKMCRILRKFNE